MDSSMLSSYRFSDYSDNYGYNYDEYGNSNFNYSHQESIYLDELLLMEEMKE